MSAMLPVLSMFRHIMDADIRCRLSPGSSSVSAVICLTMLKNAQETLLAALEQACGSCDSLCEEYAHSDENAEAVLQTIPTELLARLRKRGLCLRQLARHLVKGDTVYEV